MPSFLKTYTGERGTKRDQYALQTNAYLTFFAYHPSFLFNDDGDTAEVDRPSAKFYAYVDNFSENFASSWNAEQFYGKTDPIVGFKNTKRTMQVGWKIPSSNVEEAKAGYENLNSLATMLYPSYMGPDPRRIYQSVEFDKEEDELHTNRRKTLRSIHGQSSAQPLGKPPLIAVGWANLIETERSIDGGGRYLPDRRDYMAEKIEAPTGNRKMSQKEIISYKYQIKLNRLQELTRLLCHVENFTMSPVMEAGFFSEGEKLYPKVWNCSVNITILHTHELGRQESIW